MDINNLVTAFLRKPSHSIPLILEQPVICQRFNFVSQHIQFSTKEQPQRSRALQSPAGRAAVPPAGCRCEPGLGAAGTGSFPAPHAPTAPVTFAWPLRTAD